MKIQTWVLITTLCLFTTTIVFAHGAPLHPSGFHNKGSNHNNDGSHNGHRHHNKNHNDGYHNGIDHDYQHNSDGYGGTISSWGNDSSW